MFREFDAVAIGHGLDVDGFRAIGRGSVVRSCLFLLVFLRVFLRSIGEFLFVPGVVAEGSVGDAAGIDHDLLGPGLEGGAAEIRRGGLQGIEKKSSSAVVDLVSKKEPHALHECDLDGVRVFEDRQVERVTRTAGLIGVELDASLLPALVEMTQLTVFECGRTALDAVDLDVLTTSDGRWIKKFGNAHW
jgi:hypothetical protein